MKRVSSIVGLLSVAVVVAALSACAPAVTHDGSSSSTHHTKPHPTPTSTQAAVPSVRVPLSCSSLFSDAAAARDPLARTGTLWYPAALDADAMNEAAGTLIGLHDFAAYCKPREGATTIRTLQEFAWSRAADGVLVAEVRADAFCHSMVRALVGATVAVGEGKLSARRVASILQAEERTNEFNVVPAKGLVLVEVGYPDDAELGSRAEQTRARRDAE